MKSVFNFFIFILFTLVLLTGTVMSTNNLFVDILTTPKIVYFSFLCIPLIFIYSIFNLNKNQGSINLLDIAVIIFWLYSLVRLLLTDKAELVNQQFAIHTILLGFYFVSKDVTKNNISAFKKLLNISLIIFYLSLMFQTIIVLLQLYGLIPSFNTLYKLTGTYVHAGVLGYNIATVFVFSLAIHYHLEASDSHKYLKLLVLIGIFCCITIITVTRSRTTIVAVGIISLIILDSKFKLKNRLFHNSTKFKKTGVVLLLTVFVIGMSIGLYYYKPDSAFGRLFVWKNSCETVIEKPLFGIGYDQFSCNYNHVQAKYFNTL